MNENKNIQFNNRTLYIIFALFLVGLFISGLNAGFIGPVLPLIEKTLQVNSRLSSWVYTSYLLFFVIGSPIMAKIAQSFGRKKSFMISLLLFLIGTGLIVLGRFSIVLIILGRIFQGFGGGGVQPVAIAFIGDYFPPDKQGISVGIETSVFGVSTICGPILASFIIPYGWEYLFILNIPIMIILLIISYYYIPDFEKKSGIFNIDKKGIFLFVIVASSLAIGLNQMDAQNILISLTSFNVLIFFIVFIIGLFFLLKVEKSIKEPIIPIQLFENKEITIATVLIFIYGLAETIEIYIPSFTIVSMGLTYTQASLLMLPSLITFTIGSVVVGKLTDKYGSRKLIKTGLVSLFIGLMLMFNFCDMPVLFIVGEVFESYGLLTLVASPVRYVVLCETSFGNHSSGQAVLNMSNYIARIIGGALMGAFIASFAGTIIGYKLFYVFIIIMSLVALYLSFNLKTHEEQLETMNKNS